MIGENFLKNRMLLHDSHLNPKILAMGAGQGSRDMAWGEVVVDDKTRQAMELLVEAVAREIRPGVLELKLAARTLRDALDDPTPGALGLATRAFNAIDSDTRRRIHASAMTAAMIRTSDGSRTVQVCNPQPPRDSVSAGKSLLSVFGFSRVAPGRGRR